MTTEEPEAQRRRIIRQRNYVLAALLLAMAGLFYLITLARIGG